MISAARPWSLQLSRTLFNCSSDISRSAHYWAEGPKSLVGTPKLCKSCIRTENIHKIVLPGLSWALRYTFMLQRMSTRSTYLGCWGCLQTDKILDTDPVIKLLMYLFDRPKKLCFFLASFWKTGCCCEEWTRIWDVGDDNACYFRWHSTAC